MIVIDIFNFNHFDLLHIFQTKYHWVICHTIPIRGLASSREAYKWYRTGALNAVRLGRKNLNKYRHWVLFITYHRNVCWIAWTLLFHVWSIYADYRWPLHLVRKTINYILNLCTYAAKQEITMACIIFTMSASKKYNSEFL